MAYAYPDILGTPFSDWRGRDRVLKDFSDSSPQLLPNQVDTHGLTPVALVAEDYSFLSEGFRTLRLPRKERFHLRADTRSPQRIY